MNRVDEGTLLAGRVLLGSLFLLSGLGKFPNISGFAASLSSEGLPHPALLAAVAVMTEVVGGASLILGTLPRVTSVAMIVFTIAATVTMHRYWEQSAAAMQAEKMNLLKNLGLIGGLLFYRVAGPGALSWSSWWERRLEHLAPTEPISAVRPRGPKNISAGGPAAAPRKPRKRKQAEEAAA